MLEGCGPSPFFAGYTLAFALKLRKKHRKPSVRVDEECQLARWRYINIQQEYIYNKNTYIWTYECIKCLSKQVHNTWLANVHKAFPFRYIFSIPMCGDIPRLLFLVRNLRNLNSISRAPYYEGELYYALFGRYWWRVPTQAVCHMGPSCSVNVSSSAAKLLQGLREFTQLGSKSAFSGEPWDSLLSSFVLFGLLKCEFICNVSRVTNVSWQSYSQFTVSKIQLLPFQSFHNIFWQNLDRSRIQIADIFQDFPEPLWAIDSIVLSSRPQKLSSTFFWFVIYCHLTLWYVSLILRVDSVIEWKKDQ
jgi:hypothetical protein